MYKKLVLLFVLITIIVFNSFSQDEEFAYRPYPLILVHGFSSSPVGTWGARTRKKDGKKSSENPDKIISTGIDETDPFDSEYPIAETLIPTFEDFPGFKQESSKLLEERFLPFEEKRSYIEINHTYVELYCSYYRYESNDRHGIMYNKFGVDYNYKEDLFSLDFARHDMVNCAGNCYSCFA